MNQFLIRPAIWGVSSWIGVCHTSRTLTSWGESLPQNIHFGCSGSFRLFCRFEKMNFETEVRGITEVRDSDFKNAFPEIFNFTPFILLYQEPSSADKTRNFQKDRPLQNKQFCFWWILFSKIDHFQFWPITFLLDRWKKL